MGMMIPSLSSSSSSCLIKACCSGVNGSGRSFFFYAAPSITGGALTSDSLAGGPPGANFSLNTEGANFSKIAFLARCTSAVTSFDHFGSSVPGMVDGAVPAAAMVNTLALRNVASRLVLKRTLLSVGDSTIPYFRSKRCNPVHVSRAGQSSLNCIVAPATFSSMGNHASLRRTLVLSVVGSVIQICSPPAPWAFCPPCDPSFLTKDWYISMGTRMSAFVPVAPVSTSAVTPLVIPWKITDNPSGSGTVESSHTPSAALD